MATPTEKDKGGKETPAAEPWPLRDRRRRQSDRDDEALRLVNQRLVLSALREQELAERAERSSRQMSALLASLSVGVVVTDGAGCVTLMNAAAAKILGLPRVPEVGQPIGEIIGDRRLFRPDGGPLPFDRCPFGRAVRGERFTEDELVILGDCGARRQILATGTAVCDDEKRVISALTVLRDVSEQRELERIREEYVGLISHDLRSPLNIVTLFSSTLQALLRDRGLAEEARSAERILRVAKRMNAMIQELIDSTRMQAGATQISKQETDLHERVLAACDQVIAPAQRSRVQIQSSGAAPRVIADPERMERAIANLLTNALKYARRDSPIVVRIERRGAEAVISVTDRGPGIDHAELPKLFDRYFRARNVGKTEGLGLGLYITRLIVEAHGGRVWATSAPGEGSTFFIALPLPDNQ